MKEIHQKIESYKENARRASKEYEEFFEVFFRDSKRDEFGNLVVSPKAVMKLLYLRGKKSRFESRAARADLYIAQDRLLKSEPVRTAIKKGNNDE